MCLNDNPAIACFLPTFVFIISLGNAVFNGWLASTI